MPVPLDYEPAFIEEAVFRRVADDPDRGAFHRARERTYAIPDDEAREAAFRGLHMAWFVRLGLDRPLPSLAAELPVLAAGVERCIVRRAHSRDDEGADLFVRSGDRSRALDGRRVVILALRPERVCDGEAFRYWLRHELLHVADMLDPAFGYTPAIPGADGGPAHDRLLQERYRALWDATIDGRLARRGHAPDGVRERRLADFGQVFSFLQADAPAAFGRFFDRWPHTHAELVAVAADPSSLGGVCRRTRCPLCGLPGGMVAPWPNVLGPEARSRIETDFPGWRPEDGGALRLELGEATVEAPSGDVVEVVPEAGTLVAFLADRFWHEVRPATRERMSLTGWLRTRG